MKRDWDVIRLLLTKLEDLPPASSLTLADFKVQGTDYAYVISYHMKMLIDGGYVEGQLSHELSTAPKHFFATGLKEKGHDFLDAIRSDTIWNKTKETLAAKGIDMSFESIKTVAVTAMSSMLGLST